MRGLIARLGLALLATAAAACGQGAPASDGQRYLAEAQFRRQRLVASLVAPDNGYSKLRLARYASGDGADWDRLPPWNPPVAPAGPDGAPVGDDTPLDLTLAGQGEAGLRRLGEEAFRRYPTQLASPDVLDPMRAAGGLVSARVADGSRVLALTCASCHAGGGVAGRADASIDLGWGAGRIAVVAGEEPIAIADLRPIAYLTHLHRDGTLVNDPIALAIRVETLIITSHGGDAIRPPREVALALATYLWSLAPAISPDEPPPPPLFSRRCASCHLGVGFSGPPVPIDLVGTDPRVGLSADRGTGGYRVPSLRGVSTRGRLLHDGSVDGVDALFDPARTVPGHRFGLDAPADERSALLVWLRAL